jgi:hypothetical protein
MLCLDAALRAHLGLTIAQAVAGQTDASKGPTGHMDQPKVGAARDAPHRSGPPRCGSRDSAAA